MNFTQLMALASGHAEARIVQTSVRLGVFEALAPSPRTAAATAAELALHSGATELLLNALAALGVLVKDADQFSLTTAARQYLVRSSPKYLGAMIGFEDASWPVWERLPEAVRTGLPARPPDMYQNDAVETAIFINAMDSLVNARGDTAALIAGLDWHQVADLLDVGSGPATYPIALCRQFPGIRAVIFDLPGTLKITASFVQAAGMSERIGLIAGDYRIDPVPGFYDAVLLSNIIHGENSGRNRSLLHKLARNLKPSGKIIIKDHILDESRATPPSGAIFSLLMLLTTEGGRCYSFGEIKGWLEDAGLPRVWQVDLPPPLTSSLVIAER